MVMHAFVPHVSALSGFGGYWDYGVHSIENVMRPTLACSEPIITISILRRTTTLQRIAVINVNQHITLPARASCTRERTIREAKRLLKYKGKIRFITCEYIFIHK